MGIDIEIATACALFNCNINMHTLNENVFAIYNKYNIRENVTIINKETINILYININHYNLLIASENNKNTHNNNII